MERKNDGLKNRIGLLEDLLDEGLDNPSYSKYDESRYILIHFLQLLNKIYLSCEHGSKSHTVLIVWL